MGLVYRDTPLPSGGAVGGRPGAPASGQHQSARPVGQRPVAGVPCLAAKPVLLAGAARRAAGCWRRWEAQSCLPGPHGQGRGRQPGGPSEDPGLTWASCPVPSQVLESMWWYHPFLCCHLCSQSAALPQSGEEVSCAVGFGDRKQALGGLHPDGGGGEREEMLTSTTCQPRPPACLFSASPCVAPCRSAEDGAKGELRSPDFPGWGEVELGHAGEVSHFLYPPPPTASP